MLKGDYCVEKPPEFHDYVILFACHLEKLSYGLKGLDTSGVIDHDHAELKGISDPLNLSER